MNNTSKGLINLGNTCYINAILQCLFNTLLLKDKLIISNIEKILIKNIIKNINNINKNNILKFVDKLDLNNKISLTDKSEIEILNILKNILDNSYTNLDRTTIKKYLIEYLNIRLNKNNINVLKDFLDKSLTYELSKLFNIVWNTNNNIINPNNFIKILFNEIYKFNSEYSILEQQDSAEILSIIFNCMDSELENSVNISYKFIDEHYNEIFNKMDFITNIECNILEKKYTENNIYELYTIKKNLDQYYKKNYSIITELFKSLEFYTFECIDCNFKSYNAVSKIIFEIQIPNTNKNEYSLYECLDEYFKIEKLDCDNKKYCDYCCTNKDTLTQIKIAIPPQILIIQIKRYKYLNNKLSKLSNFINFPIHNLNINKYMTKSTMNLDSFDYELYAICNQIGSLNQGHYYSYIKSLVDNKWYIFDDTNINYISEDNIISNNAYILFYKLI